MQLTVTARAHRHALLLVLAVSLTTCTRASGVRPADAAGELEEMQQQLAAAWVDGDQRVLDAMIADDWVTTDVSGRLRTKAQVFADMFATGKSPVASMTVDDVSVRVFGDVAVVTGRTTAAGTDGAMVRLRFTDVLVRRNDRWQFVASQGTPIAAESQSN